MTQCDFETKPHSDRFELAAYTGRLAGSVERASLRGLICLIFASVTRDTSHGLHEG